MPKSDFASEELARNKLAKDITKAYDKLVQAQPDIEGKPQILIEMLTLLHAFKEVKLASDVQLETDSETLAKNLGVSVSSSPKLGADDRGSAAAAAEAKSPNDESNATRSQKGEAGRKETEQQCFQKMWKILSYGGREVSKDILTGLLHSLLTLDDSQSMETKLGLIQEAAKIAAPNEELVGDFKKMINKFGALTREVKASRYLTHFAQQLKGCKNPREEKEAKECTFVPNIDQRSRRLDVTKKKEKEKQRGTSQERLTVGAASGENSAKDAPKKFNNRQRSQSPPRHDALYENYKEIQEKLKQKKDKLLAEKEKELTFKPKISKAAEKIQEDPSTRVPLFSASVVLKKPSAIVCKAA